MKYRLVSAVQISEQNRPIFVIFGRGEDGRRYQFKVHNLESELWVPEGEPIKQHRGIKGVDKERFKSIFGVPLKRVVCYFPGVVPQVRTDYSRHYEADIHWPYKILRDRGITNGFTFESGVFN